MSIENELNPELQDFSTSINARNFCLFPERSQLSLLIGDETMFEIEAPPFQNTLVRFLEAKIEKAAPR